MLYIRHHPDYSDYPDCMLSVLLYAWPGTQFSISQLYHCWVTVDYRYAREHNVKRNWGINCYHMPMSWKGLWERIQAQERWGRVFRSCTSTCDMSVTSFVCRVVESRYALSQVWRHCGLSRKQSPITLFLVVGRAPAVANISFFLFYRNHLLFWPSCWTIYVFHGKCEYDWNSEQSGFYLVLLRIDKLHMSVCVHSSVRTKDKRELRFFTTNSMIILLYILIYFIQMSNFVVRFHLS